MKVIVNRRSQYNIPLNESDDVVGAVHFYNVNSVLTDTSADPEEKAKTVFHEIKDHLTVPTRETHDIFVLDEDGKLVFSGLVDDGK